MEDMHKLLTATVTAFCLSGLLASLLRFCIAILVENMLIDSRSVCVRERDRKVLQIYALELAYLSTVEKSKFEIRMLISFHFVCNGIQEIYFGSLFIDILTCVSLNWCLMMNRQLEI